MIRLSILATSFVLLAGPANATDVLWDDPGQSSIAITGSIWGGAGHTYPDWSALNFARPTRDIRQETLDGKVLQLAAAPVGTGPDVSGWYAQLLATSDSLAPEFLASQAEGMSGHVVNWSSSSMLPIRTAFDIRQETLGGKAFMGLPDHGPGADLLSASLFMGSAP